ncbi:MAG: MFS transporter [Caulobacteraceae bacterium]
MKLDAAAAKPPTPATSSRYRIWLLVLLILINTSNFLDRSVLGVLAPAIKRDLGISDTQIGMLGGLVFALFYTAFGIPIARVAERHSRVLLMTVAVALWSGMTALCGLAQNFVQLALARAGVGIGEAACGPSSQSLISDHFPARQRGTALAIFSLGIPIGSLIGAVAGGWIAQNLSWRTAFALMGLPGLILAALVLTTLKEPIRGHSDRKPTSGEVPPLLAVLKTLWSKPAAVWVVAGATVSTGATYGILTFAATFFVRRFGLDYAQAGLVAGLVGALPMMVSNLGGGILADVIARKDLRGYAWASMIGLIIAAPLFVLGFMQSTLTGAVVLLTLASVFQQSYLAPTYAVANNAVEPRMRATSVAVFQFTWNLIGLGLGPMVVGVMSDKFAAKLAQSSTADLLGICRSTAGAGCADASAAGIAYALMVIVLCYGLGAAAYFMSSRTMRRDLVEPI